MMTFAELLCQRKDAVVQRWVDAALATYGDKSSAALRRQKDPFANPIGHKLRTATPAIFQALLDGSDLDGSDLDGSGAEATGRQLHEIVKMRAVQQFSASDAVGFVFLLKDAVRAELPEATGNPQFAAELAALERRIDRIALVAFDVFVECREQVCELRINEVKRSVAWVVNKMAKRNGNKEAIGSACNEVDSQEV